MDIIIGGGITGLSYAMFLKHNDYLILEKENEVGGYCRTTKRNGYVWDYSGHFFHFQDRNIKEMIFSGMDMDNMVEVEKTTKIKYKDLLLDYPFQKNIHQLNKDEFIECLYDLFNKTEGNYTNFQDMLYCKFGKSIAEKFLIPYNEKLYACNLNTLDKDAMGRFFPYAEKEEIIKNFKVQNNSSYNGSFVYPKTGAIEYINAVCKRLKTEKIRVGAEVDHILLKEHKVVLTDGSELYYDRLISTMPFPILLQKANIVYDSSIYTWNQVLVFNLGFDRKSKNVTDHWIYFPEKQYSFYRVGFYNNILCQDKLSLYVELGFSKETHINPHEWLGKVLRDLKTAGIITEEHILEDYESIIMNPGYVHINNNSTLDLENKKRELETYDVYSIGRYGSWTYCSIEDNIKEAKSLVDKIG